MIFLEYYPVYSHEVEFGLALEKQLLTTATSQ